MIKEGEGRYTRISLVYSPSFPLLVDVMRKERRDIRIPLIYSPLLVYPLLVVVIKEARIE